MYTGGTPRQESERYAAVCELLFTAITPSRHAAAVAHQGRFGDRGCGTEFPQRGTRRTDTRTDLDRTRDLIDWTELVYMYSYKSKE